MKTAWWMYSNTDYGQFTMTTPNTTVPILNELVRRGHEVSLNHVPRPPHDSNIGTLDWVDPGNYKDNWDPQGKINRRAIMDIVKECSGYDQQNRCQRKIVDWVKSSEWKKLEADVQYIKSPPLVSLRNKLEAGHAILRAVLSDVPVLLIDADYDIVCILSTLDDMFKMGGWDRQRVLDLLTIVTPHQRRVWSGDQSMCAYPYDPDTMESVLKTDVDVDYSFGYVGNDYGRAEYLAEFYKRRVNGETVSNGIWGRWELDKYPELLESIGAEAFLGPIPPQEIARAYQRCAASIAITHTRFYPIRLITARCYETIGAGRLLFMDARYWPLETRVSPLIDANRFVASAEEAHYKLNKIIASSDEYTLTIAQDRERARKNYFAQPGWWADYLEALAMRCPFDGMVIPGFDGRFNKWEV